MTAQEVIENVNRRMVTMDNAIDEGLAPEQVVVHLNNIIDVMVDYITKLHPATMTLPKPKRKR